MNISSGVINIMEVLSMTNLRVCFPMVYSDLAINAEIKVIIHFCNFANMVHRLDAFSPLPVSGPKGSFLENSLVIPGSFG
jgi:hypothetical protein